MILLQFFLMLLLFLPSAYGAAGTEAASFLDIPFGAGPASLGSAYTALAKDAYAPVWNPAGLAHLETAEFAGTHLSYLQSMHYEQMSGGIPLGENKHQGLGTSIQYLGSGNIDGRTESGEKASDFSATFGAYGLSYGTQWSPALSVGSTIKLISEKIADASAKSFAADFGLLYDYEKKATLGVTLLNLGSDIKFVNEADPLPTTLHVGGVYHLGDTIDMGAEGSYRRNKTGALSIGGQYNYEDKGTFRVGYNTSHIKELSVLSGFTGGLSIYFWGQELAYAWVPFGSLGQTHYFTLVLRWSQKPRATQPKAKDDQMDIDKTDGDLSDYKNLYNVLTDEERNQLHHEKK